ncbi:autotransporter outer membrane beta-barrel domain-containing protein [Bradyrhizobium jicamae]|uniref:autotransporter outer membrane beta-barrel domain-containing protein n=1 Tax=Bradyrhizobium jicamae TaxID=280332 RepID=UPI001BADC816|nr:autotransporter outer membrane beta-barrel domain-containing protein [Bradyrhizobium jicamae]MBR0939430.1 autotransporter domain-containing protein [Bradyrhizobium jicamae]
MANKRPWSFRILPFSISAFALVTAAAVIPTYVHAEIQNGSTLLSEGPGPAVGNRNTVGSGDNPPNGTASGAIEAIATDPTNANVIYAGSVNGGVWKSTDGGSTWTPLTDQKASLSIASLSLDPTDLTHQTVIVGTGATSNGGFASASTFTNTRNFGNIPGIIYYSTNGGASFMTIANPTLTGQSITDVDIRGQTILAASYEPRVMSAGGSFYSGGLYRSTDGGATFAAVGGAAGSGLPTGPITSLVADPTNPNTFYAAVTASSNATNNQTAVYKSVDGGATWTAVFTSANSALITAGTQTTIKLAVGTTGALAVGLVNLSTGKLTGLYYNATGGAGAYTTLTAPNVNGGGQAPVNIALAIDPNSPNLIYVMGDNNFSNNGGVNAIAAYRVNATNNTSQSLSDDNGVPTNTANGSTIHPDGRVLTFDANGKLLLGVDGGIYARTSPSTTGGVFQGLNNLSTMELYATAYDGNSKRVVIAAQDNGTSLQATVGGKTFNQIQAGDGTNARVNDVTLGTSSAIYTTSQFLGQATRTIVDPQGNVTGQASVNFIGANPQNFTGPLVLNNIDPTRIAIESDGVSVTRDALTGVNGPTANAINLSLTNLGGSGTFVTTIDYGTRNNTNAILAGSFSGVAFSSTAAASSLQQLGAYTGVAPTSVKFDLRSDQRFFVADSINLYGSTNQGASFQSLTTFLPTNFTRPTSLGFVDYNGVDALLVGGVNNADNVGNPLVVADSNFAGVLSGWRRLGTGLPNTTVTSLTFDEKTDTLDVGTDGRGAFLLHDFSSNFNSAQTLQFGLANNDSNPVASQLTNGNYSARPLIKFGTGTLTIGVASTYTGSTEVQWGNMAAAAANVFAPSSAFTVDKGAILALNGFDQRIGSLAGAGNTLLGSAVLTTGGDNTSTIYSGVISGPGSLSKVGTGTFALTGINTYSGITIVSGGALKIGNGGSISVGSSLINAANFTVDNGGTATFGSVNNAATGIIAVASGGTMHDDLTNAGTVANGGSYFANVASNIGAIVNNGTWIGNVASSAGSITNNATWTGAITTAGTFTNAIAATVSGLVTNSGTGSNAGALNAGLINTGGTFNNTGTIDGTSTVSGGALFGNGSIGNLAIGNGAVFAPGNSTPGTSMTVNGSLAFSQGAFYQVAINPATASFVSASGSATLGGASVQAFFSSGTYVSKQYTIVNAVGGAIGTFGSLSNINLPSGFSSSLSYDTTHAYLNLALNLTPPSSGGGAPANNGLSINQRNVGNAFVNSFNIVGTIPIVYGALTPAGLTQASGEGATASQQTTFDAMSEFLGLITDPFMGRGNGINGSNSPSGYADESASAYAAHKKTDAFAMSAKAPLASVYQPRWSVWAAGYGGSQTANGDPVLGSNDTRSSIAGTAVGADYLFSPNTLAGFALAGGGTSFSVNNLASGRSDLFQAGAYVRHTEGAAYVTGAVAYGWQDITTNRTVTTAGVDQLRAEFNANAYSGRVESGYRFIAPWVGGMGITPYAAGQFTMFDLPAYAESVVTGTPNFVLAYAAKSVTDSRSELGFRSDKSFAMMNGVLTLRGRLAWAHDFNPDRGIGATFQALPGSSFVVNGAAQALDSALTTASVEMKWRNGWSAAATFEGEFANVTSSFAGKGVARYAW